jgi:hypothetical protein
MKNVGVYSGFEMENDVEYTAWESSVYGCENSVVICVCIFCFVPYTNLSIHHFFQITLLEGPSCYFFVMIERNQKEERIREQRKTKQVNVGLYEEVICRK